MKIWKFGGLFLTMDVVVNRWLVQGVTQERGRLMIADDGLIQITGFTALLLACCCILPLARLYSKHRPAVYQLGFLILVYAAREGDIPQKIFEFTKPTKISFYVHPDISILAKVICVGLICVCLRCCWYLISHYSRGFMASFGKREWVSLCGMAWFGFCLSMHIQEKMPWNSTYSGKVFEEVQDMLAQVMVFLAVGCLLWRGYRKREGHILRS